MDNKQKENRLVEESLKLSKLEEKFEDYKEKTSKKLAKTVEKYRTNYFYFCFMGCLNINMRFLLLALFKTR